MNFNFKTLNTLSYKLKAKSYKLNRGMTYVELIVVLSIFAVMSSIVMFNYGVFQAKVDIKNLASDIALKIVEAQKSALSGKFSSHSPSSDTTWKPAYGVYFSTITNATLGVDNKNFLYFTDRNNDFIFNDSSCVPSNINTECLDKIIITKGNVVSALTVVGTGSCPAINNLSVIFKRPDSKANITSTTNLSSCSNISYADITIHPPKGTDATIRIYPSGRIQVN